MASVLIENIREVLSQQKTMPRPSSSICATIAGLKDFCDIGPAQVDWRRQQVGLASVGGGGGGGGGGGARSTFRNSSSSGNSNMHGNGNGNSNGSPHAFTRNSSSFSLGSMSGSDSPMVGTPNATAAATPISPSAKKSGGGSPRYQSYFKNSGQDVEDKILNNIILSKLNKFCAGTYEEIREFLYQILGSGEPGLTDMIRQFMLLVFKKAASEELYCSLYAKLLSEISKRYTVILDEMNILQQNYLAIFDDVEEKEEGEKYDTFIEKNIEKRYRQGYSQFIAELSMLEIIKLSHLEETFKRIFTSILKNGVQQDKRTIIEEYIDCLFRMTRVFKKDVKAQTPFIVSAKHSLMMLSKDFIENILVNKHLYPSLSPQARFILMDVKDNLND